MLLDWLLFIVHQTVYNVKHLRQWYRQSDYTCQRPMVNAYQRPSYVSISDAGVRTKLHTLSPILATTCWATFGPSLSGQYAPWLPTRWMRPKTCARSGAKLTALVSIRGPIGPNACGSQLAAVCTGNSG